MSEFPRREFLHGAAALATASAVSLAPATAIAASDPNKPLTVGLIGCGGMGTNHLRNLVQRKEIKLAYVCDVDANRLTSAAKLVETSGQAKPVATKDLRRAQRQDRRRRVDCHARSLALPRGDLGL